MSISRRRRGGHAGQLPSVAIPATAAATANDVPFRDETPVLPAWREHLLHVFALVTICYSAYYIFWRWTSTLNPQALWISLPLAAAETASVLLLTLTVFNVWRLPRRSPPPAPSGLSVDVFITTYDEPVDVIRKTVVGANAITYPHRTFILDDGRNIELARLARELGVGYITRQDNRNAKAGNLNNALKQTNGDFILQLDADHVPLPCILDRLLGYMTDPGIAFVQAPQNFYNTEAFGTYLNRDSGRLLTDQNIFFYAIQPGKDRLNASFFCGSCAVLRRSAIEELGGFAAKTITEDIETSLLLHARGWRSIYHNETLAYGLAPRTFHGFSVQRSRWAKGGMQMLRHYNPLTLHGLTPSQRISYLAANLHALEGPTRLVFMAAPLLFLLTGVYAVNAWGPDFLAHFLPFVVLTLILHQMLARGRSGPLWFLEMVTTAKAFAHTGSFLALLTSRQLKFRVTPKGLEDTAWRAHLPFAILLALSVAALGRGSWIFVRDIARWGFSAADPLAYSVNLCWAAWNTVMVALVLRASIRALQRRPMQRFEEFLPFRLRTVSETGTEGAWVTAITENLHEAGLGFRSLEPVPVGTQVRLILPLAHDNVSVTGRILHQRPAPVGSVMFHRHGVQFDDPPQAVRDTIALHCTHHAVPGVRHLYIEQSDPFIEAVRWLRDPRVDQRERLLLPVQLKLTDRDGNEVDGLAVLEDTSRGGARLMVERPAPLGASVRYQVSGTTLRGAGRVVHCASLATPLGNRWVVGIRHLTQDTDPRLVPMRNGRVGLIRKVAMIAGLITTIKRFSIVFFIASAALALNAKGARAQVSTGFLAGAEAGEHGQSLLLLGGWAGASTGTLRPVVGIVAYRLAYDVSGGSTDVWTANPFVGLRRQWGAAGAQVNVGWAFESESILAGQRRVSSGLTTGAQIDHSGNVATALQLIVARSWGDEGYTWGRGRLAQRLGGESARVRLGAEGTVQGGGGFRQYELGPLLEWAPSGNATFVASGGWRRGESDPGDPQNSMFVRAEVVIVP